MFNAFITHSVNTSKHYMRALKLLIISFLIPIKIFSQNNTFEKYLAGFGSFEITDVLENNNNYYLLCNLSYNTFDQHSSFLIKLNSNGDTIISSNFDISYYYVLKSFAKDLNGGLSFVGSIDSLNSGFNLSQNGLIINTDLDGNAIIERSYQMSYKFDFNNIIVDDSVYFLTGNKYVNSNLVDILVVKIDTFGFLRDSLILDLRDLDAVTSINKKDDNLLISGTILSSSNDGYISLLSSSLDTTLFKKFSITYDLNNNPIALWYSYSSKFSSDSSILFPCVFFVRNLTNPNDINLYEHTGLIRTHMNGNIKSQHIYYLNSLHDRPIDIFETNDDNYVLAGTINFATRRPIASNINGDFYLMKVDTLGNILWFKQYGDSNYQEMKSVIQTSDGGFLLTGYSINNYTNQARTGFIVKTDANGNVSTGIRDQKIQELKIYPNPVTNTLYINSTVILTSYRITDLLGKVISKGEVIGNSIETENLTFGVYILECYTNDYDVIRAKFIKN